MREFLLACIIKEIIKTSIIIDVFVRQDKILKTKHIIYNELQYLE